MICWVQISSGRGPAECAWVVERLVDVGELLVTARSMAAGSTPTPLALDAVSGGLMVGVR